MSSDKSCANCRKWIEQTCRASSPILHPTTGATVWPETKATDYCDRFSKRGRPAGKRSKAPDGAVLRLIIDDERYNGHPMVRSELITDIARTFILSRTAAVSRVNVLARQGLISINGSIVKVLRPELADEGDEVIPASKAVKPQPEIET